MRRPPLPLLVSIALVLAGCGTPVGGDVTQPEPSKSATTATGTPPTPEGTPSVTQPRTTMAGSETPAASAYPPGVGPDGLTNLSALERAHRESLSQRGFVAVGIWNVSTDDRTWSRFVRIGARVGGVPAVVVDRHRENGTVVASTAQWANETVELSRSVRNGSPRYHHQFNPDGLAPADEQTGLFRVLRDGTFDAVSVTGSPGAWQYTLTATSGSLDERRPANVTLHDYRGTVVVDGDGTITRANVTATLQYEGENRTIRTTYDLDSQDGATVDRPAWVRERLPAILDTSITATKVDERFVRVEHTGRTTIKAGNEFVMWYDGCGRVVGELDAPFEPGETLYVYVSNETEEMGINRTGPGGPARPLDDPYSLSVYPPDQAGEVEAIADANVAVPANATVDESGASGAALPVSAGVTGSTATGC